MLRIGIQAKILFLIVARHRIESSERRIVYHLSAGSDVLNIQIILMRLEFFLGRRNSVIALDKSKSIVADDVVTAIWNGGREFAQPSEATRNQRAQIGVMRGMVQGVENHR